MPFPPPPLPTNFTNETAQTDAHPVNHNLTGQAVNDTVAQVIADKAELLAAIAANTSGINGNAQSIADLDNDLSALTNRVSSNEGDINTLQSTANNHEGRINNLLKDVDTGLRRHGGGWKNIGTVNGWSTFGSRQDPEYRKRGDLVDVRFEMQGGSISNYSSAWFTFPSGFRPPKDISLTVTTASLYAVVGNARLFVQSNGQSKFYGLPSNVAVTGFITFSVT